MYHSITPLEYIFLFFSSLHFSHSSFNLVLARNDGVGFFITFLFQHNSKHAFEYGESDFEEDVTDVEFLFNYVTCNCLVFLNVFPPKQQQILYLTKNVYAAWWKHEKWLGLQQTITELSGNGKSHWRGGVVWRFFLPVPAAISTIFSCLSFC